MTGTGFLLLCIRALDMSVVWLCLCYERCRRLLFFFFICFRLCHFAVFFYFFRGIIFFLFLFISVSYRPFNLNRFLAKQYSHSLSTLAIVHEFSCVPDAICGTHDKCVWHWHKVKLDSRETQYQKAKKKISLFLKSIRLNRRRETDKKMLLHAWNAWSSTERVKCRQRIWKHFTVAPNHVCFLDDDDDLWHCR